MSLKSNLESFATRLANEFNSLRLQIFGNALGDTSALLTNDKSNLINAINEVYLNGSGTSAQIGYLKLIDTAYQLSNLYIFSNIETIIPNNAGLIVNQLPTNFSISDVYGSNSIYGKYENSYMLVTISFKCIPKLHNKSMKISIKNGNSIYYEETYFFSKSAGIELDIELEKAIHTDSFLANDGANIVIDSECDIEINNIIITLAILK